MKIQRLPKRQGLYDPRFERENCGVGFIANLKGEKSHELIQQSLELLNRLEHRGAVGADPLTGDGAGILIQIPHDYYKEECAKVGITLPSEGKYGTGLVFLPRDDRAESLMQIFDQVTKEEGLEMLGWRKVPVDNTQIGTVAAEVEPDIRQIFIGAGSIEDRDAFERKLYIVRKQAGRAIRASGLAELYESYYICSLSSKTIVYKGQLMAPQVGRYYLDVSDPRMTSALSLVHSRYSTNTFPSWGRAQPMRMVAHNGEINTVQGNKNWMSAREAMFESNLFDDSEKLIPVIPPGGSDTADFDQALELLVMTGRSLPHAVMMMIPEPWSGHETMDDEKRAFFEYHASMMEPWDGPASITFTDGDVVGAVLDRNGLRPSRYVVTTDDRVIMASEVGALPLDESTIKSKGRLQPGRMFFVDLKAGRICSDEEIKRPLAQAHPYQQWVQENQINIENLPVPNGYVEPKIEDPLVQQIAFGYTAEDMKVVLAPMVGTGLEAVGSMGNDTPLAVRSERPQLLFNYFKQLFAQVTNPAIDSIREELVMSMEVTLGREYNLLEPGPENCRKLRLKHPILKPEEFYKIQNLNQQDLKTATLSLLFPVSEGEDGLEKAVENLCAKASEAMENGATILILSDRGVDENHAAIPSLLATGAVHHHLLREKTRTRVGLVVETAEAREMHHFALLIGYGAGGIYPYLAYETAKQVVREQVYVKDVAPDKAIDNFILSCKKGLYKITAKMGISTIQSYRGAQIFEAVGLHEDLVHRYFTGTPSRVAGIKLKDIAREVLARHRNAYERSKIIRPALDLGGYYHWRRGEEEHMISPAMVALIQEATRSNNYEKFKQFSKVSDEQNTRNCTIRGMFKFKPTQSIPIDEVEPVEAITRRFCTGAMSIGSISREAHETLAIAMNRLGGKSNTGEGGEDLVRYTPDANGDSRRSKIKQVASGRFGVNSNYLANADELQIKIAQGAKPGEGGQLPGHKVSEYIAKIRHSTPGVGLISPPPHHDIYSIEDLQQLIFDLHNSNPKAGVSVKLVAEAGVGTVAAGVSKARAEGVLIAGHDGGTGASPQTSIKHAGLPWELGLAETQQVLVLNDLRGRIRVQVDGQLKTGRDVVIGALLGADEFGFSTVPLVTLGCIMMRKCHLNTCSVGVATQDPELRKKFSGQADYVVNFFRFIAQEVRELMAQLGFRKLDDLIGRTDLLEVDTSIDHWKSRELDFSRILYRAEGGEGVATRNVTTQDLSGDIGDNCLDRKLIAECAGAIEHKKPIRLKHTIGNVDRATGAMLSYEISKRYSEAGLPDETIHIDFKGSAGQSFGAFLANGVTFNLKGDTNDYVGKGLSGGRIIVAPAKESPIVAEKNILIGNVVLYGAISGKAYFRGIAGERFAVRNSGADAVVEGVGDHGCEYMTGGNVVVLGKAGRNFAAGMSGGIAYVLDEDGSFPIHCNQELVDLVAFEEDEDLDLVQTLIREHLEYTGSAVAKRVLDNWEKMISKFIKVYPRDYRRVVEERKRKQAMLEEVA
ncbi:MULTISPECIES: glutamate synthase large subunit [unclassified Nitrospina]|uniref:glutamate synthase large subunit n=1 Tax=unclassified Nitrospina TaxID=2638683 RepID=UPI003F9ABDA1